MLLFNIKRFKVTKVLKTISYDYMSITFSKVSEKLTVKMPYFSISLRIWEF